MMSKTDVLSKIEGWPRKVAWSEFRDVDKSQDPKEPDLAAHTHSLIDPDNKKLKVSSQPDADGMYYLTDFGLKVHLSATTTWVVIGEKTDKLLSHEQAHYDLAGLVAMDMVRTIMDLKAKTPSDLIAEAQKWIGTYKTEWKKVDDRYDDKTNHGKKDFEQSQWKAVIDWGIGMEAYAFGAIDFAVYQGQL